MKIVHHSITLNNTDIPLVEIVNSDTAPNVIVIHGVGGNKEEQLGLSLRIAILGCNTYTVDLRGHGENILPLEIGIMNDINSLTEYLKKKGAPVIAVGHSLGGRIALLSKADYRIGISPSLTKNFSDQTKAAINNFRGYRFRENKPDTVFDILSCLPEIANNLCPDDCIIYGSRDVPDIIHACETAAETFPGVFRIENAFHNDIFTYENTFESIKKFLTDKSLI